MAEFVLKYADSQGQVRQQVESAVSEVELRDRYSQKGFLVYSIRPRGRAGVLSGGFRRPKKLDLAQFLIFNQQFMTLIRAGLPILKSLELLSSSLSSPKLAEYIRQVREDVKSGALLSDAMRAQGAFPPIYTTSIMAGEKSGSLVEVIERYVNYQKLALAVRKKVLVSLLYPSLLIVLVTGLVIFLVTYVVPNFAELYASMQAELPPMTQALVYIGLAAKKHILFFAAGAVLAVFLFSLWLRTERAKAQFDRLKLRLPLFGNIWIKYQVAQFSRVLSTLLVGGIPLLQALETSGDSLGNQLLRNSIRSAGKLVREGRPLSAGLQQTGIFPRLAVEMIEVGESTGALPAMLNSVAEFFEEDVNTRMTAALSLIEPLIMLVMGVFVAFVLVSLYLPIFSLAEKIH
ncbi:MAG TPA: type II secretion system F family protein [Bryobacterales bacterium]|jgi:type IV pilus assembly protein PilC|nr:type II secretion system F family protein [Bryobacterales bacterium]